MARAKSKKKTRSRKKKGMISVDFEGVESGGGRPVPDGNYNAFISKITEEEGQNSGEPYLHAVWKIQGGKCDGATIHDNISLQPQSLWRLRTILECIGYEVEDGPMDIDPADILEEVCGIEVTNEEYEGKDRPRITGFMGADDDYEEEEDEDPEEEEDPEEDEEEEEDEAPKKKRKSRAKKPKKLRTGSKVKFQDEEGDYVKAVIVEIEDDTAQVEDSAGDVWEVDLSELEAA